MRILLDSNEIQVALNTYIKGLAIPGSDKGQVRLSTQDGEVQAEILLGSAATTRETVSTDAVTAPDKPTENTEKPKRTRRTRAQIEADKRAEDARKTASTAQKPVEEPDTGNLFGESEEPDFLDSQTPELDESETSIFDED